MTGIPLEHALILAGILFALGFCGLLLRRNILFILMSLEIMLNAAALACRSANMDEAVRVLAEAGLTVVDVEELTTHGGSLRLYVRHKGGPHGAISERLLRLRAEEQTKGMETLAYYAQFRDRVEAIRRDTLKLLISLKEQGKSVVGYGAPGKGNTFLNYVGVRPDLLAYTTDRNPYKHGRYTPGRHIPIRPVEATLRISITTTKAMIM